jgi:hypothetical protein
MISVVTEKDHSDAIQSILRRLPETHRSELLRSIESIIEAFDRNKISKVYVPAFEHPVDESMRYILTEFQATTTRLSHTPVNTWQCTDTFIPALRIVAKGNGLKAMFYSNLLDNDTWPIGSSDTNV